MYVLPNTLMSDIDVLQKLKELNSESKDLLEKVENLNKSFDNCTDLVANMGSISARIKKAVVLYNDILASSPNL